MNKNEKNLAVIAPCQKAIERILGVIARLGSEARLIYTFEKKLPDKFGDLIQGNLQDPHVRILCHEWFPPALYSKHEVKQ